MTYEPTAKVYRSCYIEEGTAMILLGTWDKDTQTMTWKGADAAGNKHTATHRFADKDHVEWSIVVTAADGKVVVELSAKQTRRKQ